MTDLFFFGTCDTKQANSRYPNNFESISRLRSAWNASGTNFLFFRTVPIIVNPAAFSCCANSYDVKKLSISDISHCSFVSFAQFTDNLMSNSKKANIVLIRQSIFAKIRNSTKWIIILSITNEEEFHPIFIWFTWQILFEGASATKRNQLFITHDIFA